MGSKLTQTYGCKLKTILTALKRPSSDLDLHPNTYEVIAYWVSVFSTACAAGYIYFAGGYFDRFSMIDLGNKSVGLDNTPSAFHMDGA